MEIDEIEYRKQQDALDLAQARLAQEQKIKRMQMMGRKIYKDHLNANIKEQRDLKNYRGLQQVSDMYKNDLELRLQKGGNK